MPSRLIGKEVQLPLYADYPEPTTRSRLPGADYPEPITRSRLPGADYPEPITRSRLPGADYLEVYYKGQLMERMERVRGEREARVDYRHIIGSLVREPGAFARYRFREQMFPARTFRLAYDALRKWRGERADVEYVRISWTWRRQPWSPRWTKVGPENRTSS